MSVIANTTVISNFSSIDQLDLLRQIYGTLYIPVQVYDEIQQGLDEGYSFYTDIEDLVYPLAECGWIRLTSLINEREFSAFGRLPSTLHPGEASCLAIAYCRDWALLTDDQAARKQAVNLEIRLSGTLGCLVLGVDQSIFSINKANTWLYEMISQGYHSPVDDLTILLTV